MEKIEKVISEGIECYRISDKALSLIGKIVTSQYSKPEFEADDRFESACDSEVYIIKKFLSYSGLKIKSINIEGADYCGWDYFTFAAITTNYGLYFYKSNNPFYEQGDIPDIKEVKLPEGMTVIEACEKALSEIVDTQNYYMKEYKL